MLGGIWTTEGGAKVGNSALDAGASIGAKGGASPAADDDQFMVESYGDRITGNELYGPESDSGVDAEDFS